MLELIIAAGLLGTGIAACSGESNDSESSDNGTNGDHDITSSSGDRQSTFSEF